MGIPYAISYVPQVATGDRYGETAHTERTIEVETGLSHDLTREIVLHETFHQLCYQAGLSLPEETEETVATMLARALVGHMRDNPSYWKWLLIKPPKEQTKCPPSQSSPSP